MLFLSISIPIAHFLPISVWWLMIFPFSIVCRTIISGDKKTMKKTLVSPSQKLFALNLGVPSNSNALKLDSYAIITKGDATYGSGWSWCKYWFIAYICTCLPCRISSNIDFYFRLLAETDLACSILFGRFRFQFSHFVLVSNCISACV